MKKITAILLCLALLMLAACGGSPSGAAPASEHDHTAEDWSADHQNHWRSCPDCGTEYDKAAHTIENDKCTVCQTDVFKYEDGAVQITCYNKHGDEVAYISYTADGQEQSRDRLEYQYNAEGKKLSRKIYAGDVLSSEVEYGYTPDGEQVTLKEVFYEDGTVISLNQYDQNGNTLLWVNYAADGSEESRNEYEYSADGNQMTEKTYYEQKLQSESVYDITDGNQIMIANTAYYEDGGVEKSEYDKYGNPLLQKVTAADGSVESEYKFEHEYDDQGRITLTRSYENGRLTHEQEYINGSDEEGEWSRSGKNISYHADGSKTVCDADPDGAWSSEITYDSQGNVTEELRYEYEYNDNGDQTVGRSYENGKLTETMEAVMDQNGETEFIIRTRYLEDGGKRVRKYDTNFDIVEETTYDANGKVKAN